MGHDTLLYARETDVVESVNDASLKENSTFLKVSPCRSWGWVGGCVGVCVRGGGGEPISGDK
jgi:hypothetical protein